MKNSLDNIELRSEEVQDILTRVPHWMIRWGNLLFLGLIILLLGISWFIKYPDIIAAESVITTQIPPEKEYARVSGKIEAILVEDNAIVEPDQPLAIIENTANYEDVYKLKETIDTITLSKKSFSFPKDVLPILFLGDIETQFALFENNYNLYLLNKNYDPITNQLKSNHNSIAELQRQLRNLQSQRTINKSAFDLAKSKLNRQKQLFDKGVISAQQLESEQINFAQAERNYKNFENSISQTRNALNQANMASKGTEIEQIKEEITLLKTVLQSFNQLKKAIRDWESNYVLKSSIEGKVSFLNYWNSNQYVRQGDLVFTIIPNNNSSYIAKLKTPAQNSGKIKVGQNVNVNLDNYPSTEFGVLNGTVNKISLTPNEEGLYVVDVKLPEKLTTSYNKTIEFKQEMRGSAEIITKDLRLMERFFYQLKELVDR
jgi:multidrug resistance efflux pump